MTDIDDDNHADRKFAAALFNPPSDNPDDAEDDQPDDLTKTIRALFRS